MNKFCQRAGLIPPWNHPQSAIQIFRSGMCVWRGNWGYKCRSGNWPLSAGTLYQHQYVGLLMLRCHCRVNCALRMNGKLGGKSGAKSICVLCDGEKIGTLCRSNWHNFRAAIEMRWYESVNVSDRLDSATLFSSDWHWHGVLKRTSYRTCMNVWYFFMKRFLLVYKNL